MAEEGLRKINGHGKEYCTCAGASRADAHEFPRDVHSIVDNDSDRHPRRRMQCRPTA